MSNNFSDRGPFCVTLEDTPQSFATHDILEAVKEFNPQSAVAVSDNTWIVSLKTRTDAEQAIRARRISVLSKEEEVCTVFIKACRPEEIPGILKQTESDDNVPANLGGGQAWTKPDSNEKVEFRPGLPDVQFNTSSDPSTAGTPPRQHNPAMQQHSFGYEPMGQKPVHQFQPSAQHVFQSPGSSFLSPGIGHPWGPNPSYPQNQNYPYYYGSPGQQPTPSHGHAPPYAAQYPGYHPSYPANPYQQGGGYYPPQYYPPSAMDQSKKLTDEFVSPAESRSPIQSVPRSKHVDNADEDVEVKNESVLKEIPEVQQQGRQGSLATKRDDKQKQHAKEEQMMATASRKLKVSNIPHGVTCDALQLLFENEKRSGGGEVKSLDFDTGLATAVIEFEDPSVIDRVLEKLPLAIQGQQLKIKVYKELVESEKVVEEADEHMDLPKTTVEVSGFSQDTSKDSLEMYFENNKRSGGGPISNIDWKDKVALITFESEAVANAVLQKSHKFGGMDLKVKLYVPPPPVPMYKDKLLITGLNEKVTEDCLTNFLEARGDVSPTEILYAEDDDELKALVTFESPPDLKKLQDGCQKKKLEGATLVISQVPISRCVLVTNLATKTSEDTVQLYFENAKRSGGGSVEKVEMNKEAGECLIYFEDFKVLDSVLWRDHKLDNSEIQLQLFHPCFSKTSNAENKGKLQNPESASNKAVSKGSKKLTGMDVDDKPCKPVPMYKDKLLITGLNEKITEDLLINFLEARGGVSPTETLYSEDDENKVLVSFESPPDLHKLQDACQKKKLEGATLVISQVPISRCVLVTNLATKTSEDTLQLYFENARRSGGGSVEKVEMNKEAGECLIYFEDLNVVDSVIGRKHTLDNSDIQLQLYHPCIGRTTSIENRGKFQNPDSFVFKVNLHFIAFFRQVPNAKVRLEQELSKVHVRLVVPSGNSDTLEVVPTLNAEMEGAKKLAKTWKETAEQNLETYMQQLDCLEHQVMPDIWASTVTSLQKVHIPKAEDVIVCADQQQNIIRVVGFKDMVSHVSNSLKQIICDGEKELELKKQRTSDKRNLPQHEIYFLSAVNFPGKVRDRCREVECRIQQEDSSIVFEGILLDIKQAQLLMFETIQTIARSSMPDYSRSKMELLAMKETCDYIRQRLEENGCMGLWESDGSGVIVYDVCDQKANEGIQIIKKCLVENTINITPEQSVVINSDAWNTMLADINRQHHGQTIIRALVRNSTIEITATDQIAGTVIEIVQDFISANTLYKKIVTVDLRKMRYLEQWKKPQIDEICTSQQKNMVNIDLGQGVITLRGTQKGLREAKDKMSTLLKQMCCKQKSIEKPGIGKYLYSDKGEELIKHIENVNKCTIDLINEEEVETKQEESQMELEKHLQHPVECLSCKMLGGRTMSVFHGDITDLDIHVLINPCNNMLDHSAGLAKAVVEKGGLVVLNECAQLKRKKLMDGDVVCTKGGNLKCKIVAHGVSPIWQGGSENEEEYLKEVVLKSLEETDKKRLSSIGIPAIGTGVFGWPTSVATLVIVRTVQDYFQDNSSSVIRNVYLCDLDAEHLKAFIDAVKQSFPAGDLTIYEDPSQIATRISSSVGTNSGGSENISVSNSKIGTSPHKIQVIKGEMARQQADALVNTTSSKLNLSQGAVSASLLAAGGQQLQDECKANYPNGITYGEVAITRAGELRSSCVIHGCLPDWSDDGSTLLILTTFMNNCLSEADQRKLTSIAFPALGTGTLKYPKDVVAREMFNCVSDFLTKNASTSLVAVYFVVYQEDLETLMAFEKEEKEFLKRIYSPSKEDESAELQKRQRHGGEGDSDVSTTSSKRQSSEFTQVPQVKIIPGDITTCIVDAIVNPTNDTVCLEGGASRAILRKAGPELKEMCSTLGKEMKKKGFVVTPGFNLVSGCIIHVNVRSKQYGWKEIILKCLEEAVKRKLRSIAFPALGTGNVGGNPEEIGKALFEATCEIIQAGNNTLQEIQMVVFQPEMVSKIEEGIKSAQESVPKTSTWFDYIKGFFGYRKKASTVQPHVLRDDGMKVFLYICAESENVIEDALDNLDTNFNKELEIDSITDDVIKRLHDDKISEIERIGRKRHALIKVEKRLGRVRIEGLHADVGKVKSEVVNLIRSIEKMENKEKQAAMLSQLVQWYYIEITADGQDLVEYSKDVNVTIEEAYQRKEKIVRVQADVPIIIDFDAFEEYPVKDPDDKVKVLRKDKIKDSVSEMPPQWDPMDKDNLKLILLQPASKEYTDVVSLFMATVKKENTTASVPISKIERIQNRTLYAQYQSKKKLIDEMNPGQTNEMDLWHGTAGQAVDSINVHGFNRSFCGKNATKYGEGVYFAKESYYSARDLYSPPDAAGNKKMYLTKVLTGKYALGKEKMRVPPPLVVGRPELHDSVVDDINTPFIFVIFHDTQAYPKYLITFKWN
ncbi:hypothetical protein ACJMK2_004965 [Sinanodonta woodiana]|uniref:Poly [ADP-ribose] polymerase n=1 Tax=Sinanodonta woodiana TaxID=1069815 RepID=A0ABD3VNQ8_SINWO